MTRPARTTCAAALRGLAPAILAVTVLAAPLGAQVSGQNRSPAVPAALGAAQDFLGVAYPDLLRRSVRMTLQPAGSTLVMHLEDAVNPLRQERDSQPPALLDAVLDWGAGGTIARYAASGALVEQTRNRAFRQALTDHPQWADADALGWLISAGAVTQDDRTAPAALHFEAARWTAFLGAAPQAGAVTFQYRDDTQAGPRKPFRARPAWVLPVTGTDGAGHPQTYQFEFEPLAGRLVAITRQ